MLIKEDERVKVPDEAIKNRGYGHFTFHKEGKEIGDLYYDEDSCELEIDRPDDNEHFLYSIDFKRPEWLKGRRINHHRAKEIWYWVITNFKVDDARVHC